MELKEKIINYNPKIENIYKELSKKIVGQKNFIQDILIALFSGGHILIEGAPGLAKTLTVDTLAKSTHLDFKRIQFTPDLLPSDLLGNNIYNIKTQDFNIKFGPVFTNFLLADEINRAPSKVQSALLEAMAEKQVSIGDATYKLNLPFIVLATQNPIEQEGTFNLPEAQLDRFLLKTIVDYPTKEEELDILRNYNQMQLSCISQILEKKDILDIQDIVNEIYVSENVLLYITDLVSYTRDKNNKISKYVMYGVSPRASIALLKSSKSLAFLNGRDFVIPEDIKQVIYPVFRHRIILNYEAMADDIKKDDIIKIILSNVDVK